MLVSICQRSINSGTDQNLTVVDTKKLQEMVDSNHKNKNLAEQWLKVINILYDEFQKGKKLWFYADYVSPKSYSPKEATVETYPVMIDFMCEVWIG